MTGKCSKYLLTKVSSFIKFKSRLVNYYLFIPHTGRNSSEEKKKNFEDKKKEQMKKNADHENVVVLSLVIEAAIEASFQESVKKCKI